jgi:hypothetical protein
MKRHTAARAVAAAALGVGALAFLPNSAAAARVRHHNPAAHRAKARTFSFYAEVVSSSPHGLLLRHKSGKTVFFSARQLSRKHALHKTKHHATRRHPVLAHMAVPGATPPVTVNIVGLEPGVTVLVTETVNPDGSVTITITLPPAGTTGEQSASGVVNDVGDDVFEMQTGDGSDLRLHMAADALANLNLDSCTTVSVTYHQDAGLLIADTVQVTGTSTSGDCQPESDATGTITQVSGSAVSISTDQGPMTFGVDDSGITDGFQVGDVVDVTYTDNGDGTFTADDVEYVESDAGGTVTAVSPTSMTITDATTGQPDTFVTDPGGVTLESASFQGIQPGDQVDVTYHTSNGQLVADAVNDNSSSGDSSSSSDSSSGDSSSSCDGSSGE